MVCRCVVFGCSREKASIHEFPASSDQTVRKGWTRFVQRTRSQWRPTAKCYVCSKHFTDADFKNKIQFSMGLAKRLLLKKDAIPTVYPDEPTITSMKHPPVTSSPTPLKNKIGGKPSALFDFSNPDWAPTLKLGHDKITKASAADDNDRQNFVGGKGPTEQHSDPIQADESVTRPSRKQRAQDTTKNSQHKRQKLDVSDTLDTATTSDIDQSITEVTEVESGKSTRTEENWISPEDLLALSADLHGLSGAVATYYRKCKRLSKVYVSESEGNQELAETKELMLNTLFKCNLEESTLIDLLTWMRSLIVVRGECVGTEGLYYLAEVEDQTPNAKKALDKIVISENNVQRKTHKKTLINSNKINVSFHLQHKQMKPTCKLTPRGRKMPRIVNSSVYSTDIELGERKTSCETNCTQVMGVNPIPVTLVRVDHGSPNTRLLVFNNPNGTSKGVPNISGVSDTNIDIEDQILNSTENKAAKHDSETELNQISVPYIKREPVEASDMKDGISNSTQMHQISVPYIKQEPIEASDMKDQISYSTENKAARHDSETEINQISVPCIKQELIEADLFFG